MYLLIERPSINQVFCALCLFNRIDEYVALLTVLVVKGEWIYASTNNYGEFKASNCTFRRDKTCEVSSIESPLNDVFVLGTMFALCFLIGHYCYYHVIDQQVKTANRLSMKVVFLLVPWKSAQLRRHVSLAIRQYHRRHQRRKYAQR